MSHKVRKNPVCILALYDLKFIKFQINELFVDTLSSQLLILCLYNCGYSVFTILDTLSSQDVCEKVWINPEIRHFWFSYCIENLLKDARGARSDCQERTEAGRPQVCWRVSAWVRVISVVMREHQVPDAVLDIELAGRSEDIDQDWRWDETVLPL